VNVGIDGYSIKDDWGFANIRATRGNRLGRTETELFFAVGYDVTYLAGHLAFASAWRFWFLRGRKGDPPRQNSSLNLADLDGLSPGLGHHT
jgi:hypothetical protein